MGELTGISETSSALRAVGEPEVSSGRVIERLLRAMREHLGLDVAFVGEVRRGSGGFATSTQAPASTPWRPDTATR